jgi:hypothetical protein
VLDGLIAPRGVFLPGHLAALRIAATGKAAFGGDMGGARPIAG